MRIAILIAAATFALMPTTALAHALGVAYSIKGDKVEIEAFYDDDTAAHKAKVIVVNAKDEEIANGITDKAGQWSFATPAPGKYEIRVDAGAGHRARKTLNVPGVGPSPPSKVDDDSEPEAADSESRYAMTRTPWQKIGVGLTIIALGGCALTLGLAIWRQGKTHGC